MKTVLIVDDNIKNLDLFKDLLKAGAMKLLLPSRGKMLSV